MSLIATFALAVSAGSVLPQCSWDRPGVNPFMGDVVAAVDHYPDIPAATREKLKARMKARTYDDIAVIERDGIKGKGTYAPEISDMHFGPGAVCRTVTRTKWTAKTQERGLVYCEDGQCILVPTVCRNVSRIRRLSQPTAVAPAQANNVASSAGAGEDVAPLEFEAPAAGPMAASPAAADSFAQQAGVPSLTPPAQAGGTGLPFASGAGPTMAQASPTPGLSGLGVPALPPGRVVSSPPVVELPGGGIGGNTPAVPEPDTWAMSAMGLLVVVYRASRRRG